MIEQNSNFGTKFCLSSIGAQGILNFIETGVKMPDSDFEVQSTGSQEVDACFDDLQLEHVVAEILEQAPDKNTSLCNAFRDNGVEGNHSKITACSFVMSKNVQN